MSGEWAEEAIPKVTARKRIVFSVEGNMPSLSANDPIGKLLERLIGLCFSGPSYLRPDDAARYIVLLHELKQFSCRLWKPRGWAEVKVEHLPIAEIGSALEDWIQSYFDDNRCALLPAYALDTAKFIKSHVSGHYQLEPELWEIEPMVNPADRGLFRFIDARFKSNFTSRFGGTLVRCRVPNDCAIEFQNQSLVSSGQDFYAAIKRCHLSSTVQDAIFLHTDVPDEATIDLGFWFIGEILLSSDGALAPVLFSDADTDQMLLYNCRRFDLHFPANWIRSVGQYANNRIYSTPVPRWEAEVGEMRSSAAEKLPSSTIQ